MLVRAFSPLRTSCTIGAPFFVTQECLLIAKSPLMTCPLRENTASALGPGTPLLRETPGSYCELQACLFKARTRCSGTWQERQRLLDHPPSDRTSTSTQKIGLRKVKIETSTCSGSLRSHDNHFSSRHSILHHQLFYNGEKPHTLEAHTAGSKAVGGQAVETQSVPQTSNMGRVPKHPLC